MREFFLWKQEGYNKKDHLNVIRTGIMCGKFAIAIDTSVYRLKCDYAFSPQFQNVFLSQKAFV